MKLRSNQTMEVKNISEHIRENKLLEAEKHIKQKIAAAARFNAEGLSGDWKDFAFGSDRKILSMDQVSQDEMPASDLNDKEKEALRSRLIPIFMFTDHDWQSIAIDTLELAKAAEKNPDIFSSDEKKLIREHYQNLSLVLNLTWRGIADFIDPTREVEKADFSARELLDLVASQLKIRNLSARDSKTSPDDRPFFYAYDRSRLDSKIEINGPAPGGETKMVGSPGLFFLTHYNIAKNGVALAQDLLKLSLDRNFEEIGLKVVEGKSQNLAAYQKQFAELSAAMKVRESLLKKLGGKPFTINCEIVENQNSVLVHIFDNGLGFDLNVLKEQAKLIAETISNPQNAENDVQLQATIDSLSEEMKGMFERWVLSPYYFKEILPLLPDLTKLNRLSGSSPVAGSGHSGLGLYACDVLMKKSGGDLVAGESAEGGAWFCTIFPKDTARVDDTKRKIREGKLLPKMKKAA